MMTNETHFGMIYVSLVILITATTFKRLKFVIAGHILLVKIAPEGGRQLIQASRNHVVTSTSHAVIDDNKTIVNKVNLACHQVTVRVHDLHVRGSDWRFQSFLTADLQITKTS